MVKRGRRERGKFYLWQTFGKHSDAVFSVDSGVYKRRETKFDPKYMVFGTSPTKENHFAAKVNKSKAAFL